MKNLKVRLKLTIGFAIITGLLVIVGVIGAIGMLSLNKADNNLYNCNVTAMDALGSIRENYAQQRAIYRNLVIYDSTSAYYQSSAATMSKLEAEMDAYIETYGAVIEKKEEKDAFNSFLTDYRGGFKSFKEELLSYGAQNETEKAKDILSRDSILQLSNSINASLDECYKLNVAYAKETVDSNSALAYRSTAILAGVIAAAFIIAMSLTVYISGLIVNPLLHMSSFLEKVQSTGDLNFAEEDQGTLPEDMKLKDEIGRCVNACASLVYRILDVKEKLTLLSDGDLTMTMDELSDKDSIGIAFNTMIKRLNAMFTEIRGASNQVSSGSQQIAQGAQALASGSSQQSSSIEEFSASLLELSDKTKQTAGDTVKSQEYAHQSETMIGESIKHMGEMLVAMKQIDDSSKSITKVIKVIDDIAFQTNILALNAAVEAARAGQHGKGFAVVADEVRNLASKSSDAAKETAALIDGSVERVKEGNQIVEKTNSSLDAVVAGAKEAAILLQNVAAASTEQAKAIQEMNQSLEQISSVVQENSASAEQSAASSEEMSAQAALLSEIVSSFKLKETQKRGGHDTDKPASFSGIALKKDGIL